jgi:two-component system phosphate regulon sensor histidine kinase PhoR
MACIALQDLKGEALTRTMELVMRRSELRLGLETRARALFENEPSFHRLISGYSDGIIVVGGGGLVQFVNSAAQRMLGCSSACLVGREFGVPLVGPRQFADLDIDRGDGDGQLVVEMRITEIDWGGDPARLVSLRDVTPRARLKEAQEELASQKDDFVSNVSHQLRTPLHTLKGSLGLLRHGQCPTPEIAQEFLDRAAGAVDRLSTLVDDLLEVFRMESGRLQLQLRPVDLADLVQETLRNLNDCCRQKEIALLTAVGDELLLVDADRHWLSQALTNLVENAVKFSERGGTVRLAVSTDSAGITVRVTDQGPGIPAESLPRLFDRFYQAESRAKRAGQGSGLGLYIVKGIVEAHGGTVGVESTVGKGSSFFFTLPKASCGAAHVS